MRVKSRRQFPRRTFLIKVRQARTFTVVVVACANRIHFARATWLSDLFSTIDHRHGIHLAALDCWTISPSGTNLSVLGILGLLHRWNWRILRLWQIRVFRHFTGLGLAVTVGQQQFSISRTTSEQQQTATEHYQFKRY